MLLINWGGGWTTKDSQSLKATEDQVFTLKKNQKALKQRCLKINKLQRCINFFWERMWVRQGPIMARLIVSPPSAPRAGLQAYVSMLDLHDKSHEHLLTAENGSALKFYKQVLFLTEIFHFPE